MICPKAPRPAASGGLRRSAAAGMTKARCRVILGALLTQAEAAPMPTVEPFPAGGYRFISHQFQYSGGIAAEPGFRIEHARAELLGFDASFERRVDALAEQDFQVDAAGGGGAVGAVGVAEPS